MIPSLATFALEVISNCVHNATENMLQLVQVSSSENINKKHLLPTCKYLAKIISDIPPNHANDVCEKLIRCVGYTTYEYVENRIPLRPIADKSHLDIASAITNSILHPSVSKLHFPPLRYDDTEYYLYMEYVKVALQKVDSVNSLALTSASFNAVFIKRNKEKFKNLEELKVCRMDVLQELIQVCPTIKKLVFANPMAFPFRSLEMISSLEKFSSLKHLQHLDIGFVSISQGHVTQIIENLSDNSVHPLKMLKCVLSEDQATLVVKRFPHLISLKVIQILYYSLIMLKGLNELVDLEVQSTVTNSSFSAILKEYLKECGKQLLKLTLINIPGTDLNFVAQQCLSLVNLGLLYNNQDDLGFPYEQPLHIVHLCKFLNVKYCEFEMNSYDLMRFILSKCLKLEMAFLKSQFDYLCFDNLKFFSQNMSEVKFRIRLSTGDTLHIWGNYKSISYLNGRTQCLTIEEMSHRYPNFL